MSECPFLNQSSKSIPAKIDKNDKKIVAYQLYDHKWKIEPATSKRVWMDNLNNGNINRCLPLKIASEFGWIIYCPVSAAIEWNGMTSPDDIRIIYGDDTPKTERQCLSSHFGSGVFTLNLPWVFRTPVGTQIMVRGVPNYVYDGITPLEGVVETDWLSFTFTVNFRVNRPLERVYMRSYEPLVLIHPVSIDNLEEFQLESKPINENSDFQEEFMKYTESRADFIARQQRERIVEWQGHYFRGETIDEERVEDVDPEFNHKKKIKLKGKA